MEHLSPTLINSKISHLCLLDREAEAAGKTRIHSVMKEKKRTTRSNIFLDQNLPEYFSCLFVSLAVNRYIKAKGNKSPFIISNSRLNGIKGVPHLPDITVSTCLCSFCSFTPTPQAGHTVSRDVRTNR